MFAYVGGYTTPDRDGRGEGITVYRVARDATAWTPTQRIGGLENPSLFTLNRAGTRLYCVHGGRELISAFAIDRATGHLTLLNQMNCLGANPVDSALDPTERHLVIANYATGGVAVMPLDTDGRLQPVSQVFVLTGTPGPDPVQQPSSHPHAVIFDPSGRFVIVPDKGFDCTFIFRFENAGVTATAQGSVASRPGAAPRHATFHPRLPVLYVNNELDSTVTAFHWNNETGEAREMTTVTTLPAGHPGRNTTAEIVTSADGRFLYVSNRGQDAIARYALDPVDGRPTYLDATPTGGRRPRFFAIDPTGAMLYAANQDSDDITAFRIDPATGVLSPSGLVIGVGSPSAISFVDG
jgi:6-phosphogluconolactonase (cycloisomerase 2 family)